MGNSFARERAPSQAVRRKKVEGNNKSMHPDRGIVPMRSGDDERSSVRYDAPTIKRTKAQDSYHLGNDTSREGLQSKALVSRRFQVPP
ncbi:MAG: hypothetical protein QM784_33725 [Polyangiaceae bacterium]